MDRKGYEYLLHTCSMLFNVFVQYVLAMLLDNYQILVHNVDCKNSTMHKNQRMHDKIMQCLY